MNLKVEYFGRLQPGVEHIVGVADPGDGFAANIATMLDEREHVGKNLARVVFVGQSVDNRDARMTGKPLDDALLEGTDHHQVAHPRDDLGSILDRLAAAQLRVLGIQKHCAAAELLHSCFK